MSLSLLLASHVYETTRSTPKARDTSLSPLRVGQQDTETAAAGGGGATAAAGQV